MPKIGRHVRPTRRRTQFRRQQAKPFPDKSFALQAWGNLEQRHQERTGDKLPKDMRPAMLLAKGVDSTATPVPGFQQVRAHIFRVIKARTRGPAPVAVGNLNSEFGGQ